jgi:hypothetical protein
MLYQKLVKILCLAMLAVGCSSEGDYYYSESVDGMGGAVANLGWSSSGEVKTRTLSGPSLQVNFPLSGNYTVQLNVNPLRGDIDPISGLVKVSRPRAEVIWSVKGNGVRRLFDVVDGASITGQAEAVKVKIFDTIDQEPGNPVAPNISYPVSIQVTKGIRAVSERPILQGINYTDSAGNPLVSYQDVTMIPGDFVRFQIPQDAGVTSFQYQLVTSNPLTNITMAVQDYSGNFLRYSPENSGTWLPIRSGASEIFIRNNGAANCFASVFFGIDG